MTDAYLQKNIEALKKQRFWLLHSYGLCLKTGIKESYTLEETDSFETLCGRFARTIDFLIRKVFRSIDAVEFDTQGTLIDTVNRAHKRGIFENMEEITQLRDIRNEIVHEYIDEALLEIFEDVLTLTPNLIKIVDNTIEITGKYIQTLD